MFGRRCAACRMVRLNDFDNAEHWLERARRELAEKKDILDRRDDHFNNLGYLSFIAGTLDFKKYFHTGEPLAKPLFPGIKTESDGARIRIGARTPFYFASSSEECNKSVVAATLQQLHKVRALGTPRQLIAVACSIRHANQVAALYRAHGLIV